MKLELYFLEGMPVYINEIANSATICYRLKNDFRIYIQKVFLDLNLNIVSLGPCEILSSQLNGVGVVPSTFTFMSDSLCIMSYDSTDGTNSLILWEKDSVDSTSLFFDSFQDKELGSWKVTHQHLFPSKVTCIRKRDLSAWIGLANGSVFELQVKPWNIQERDSQGFPFLNWSLFVNELNSESATRNFSITNGMMDVDDVTCHSSWGPVEYLMESCNELVVLSAHKEDHGWRFKMNHFLGEISTEG